MPTLNGGRVNARTNSAFPDHHLHFDDRQLDHLQGYDFQVHGETGTTTEPASEVDVPESPLTKQLREEHEEHKRRNKSQQKPAELEQSRTKLLKRPSSGGNNVEAPLFAPPPPPPQRPLKQPQAARAVESTTFCFAPINGKADTVSKRSSEQARPRSHTPTISPHPGTSVHVHPSHRACSPPESGGVVPTKVEIHDAITITSDPAQSVAEDNIQDGEDPQEPQTNQLDVAPESMDGTTLNESTVHQDSPAVSEHDGTSDAVRLSPQHSPAPAPETFVGENEVAEEAITPATPSAAPGSLNAPRTPKKRHPAPVLVSPAGIGKANLRARNKSSGIKHGHMTPESTPPSEEDLLYVLMHRYRERGEATQKSLTKIKTLEHRNFELHKNAQEIYQERDNAIAAQIEASEKYSSLKASLGGFKSKYSKLKNFARSTHQDLLLLRQGADVQKASFQDLKQLGDHVQSSLRDACASARGVQTSLDKQTRGLATIRSEADSIVSESTQASTKLNASSGRIKELTKEKSRLEGHVVSLENAQQRATQAARDSNRDVSTALVKVTQRLDAIEFAALQPPQPSDAAEHCLVLLQTLQRDKGPVAKQFQELAKSVAALQNTVLKGVQSIGRDYRSPQTAKRGQDLGKVVEQLKKYVEGLQLSAMQVQHSNEERVALEARLKGAQDMIKELQKSVARAESYVATFQTGMETISNTSNAHRERQTQLQSQTDQYQIRYSSKCSELATVKQELTDKCQAMDKEVNRLQALLSVEKSKQEDVEEKLRSAQSENAQVSHDNDQALRNQLSEKTIALEQAHAAELAAKEDSDKTTAQLKQKLETLQQSHEALKSTSQKVQLDAEELHREHKRLQGQLKIAVEHSVGAEKLKEQLANVEARCGQAEKEVEGLRGTRSQLDQLRQQFESQQEEADTKTAEMSRLREQLVATEQYPATVEQLKNKVKSVEHDAKSLQEKLAQVTAEAVQVGDLQETLSSKSATVEKLEIEAKAGRETRQKLEAVSKEKENLAQGITEVRNHLIAAQQQIGKHTVLEERLKEREEEIAQLRQQVDQAQELSQSVAAQKQESQEKDSQIANLRVEIDRMKAESQESAEAQAINSGSQLAELNGFMTQQSHISFLQASQTQRPNGSESHRLQDQAASNVEEWPRRRVADRSAVQKLVLPPRPMSQPDLRGSQPQSTNSTNVVPNSQVDAHNRDALGIGEAERGDHRDSSPQSAVQSDNEEPAGEDANDLGSSQLEIPETLQDTLGPFNQHQGLQTQHETFADRDANVARPSSSATSVDLFKQHETNLDAATHAWKPSHSNSNTPDRPRSIRGHGHPKPASQSTVAPGQLQLDSSGALPTGDISPKVTRSGLTFRERFVTPTPDLGPSNVQEMMEITPTLHKERHQPNSAVKRSAEGDGPPAKRLERHPERLAVRNPSKPANHLASGSNQSNTTPGSRKGGSVVGTPAPAPGKSQKSSKAPRKSSKKDKYSAKFAESS